MALKTAVLGGRGSRSSLTLLAAMAALGVGLPPLGLLPSEKRHIPDQNPAPVEPERDSRAKRRRDARAAKKAKN